MYQCADPHSQQYYTVLAYKCYLQNYRKWPFCKGIPFRTGRFVAPVKMKTQPLPSFNNLFKDQRGSIILMRLDCFFILFFNSQNRVLVSQLFHDCFWFLSGEFVRISGADPSMPGTGVRLGPTHFFSFSHCGIDRKAVHRMLASYRRGPLGKQEKEDRFSR